MPVEEKKLPSRYGVSNHYYNFFLSFLRKTQRHQRNRPATERELLGRNYVLHTAQSVAVLPAETVNKVQM